MTHSFEAQLLDGIHRHLVSEQYRYVDNSQAYYVHPSAQNMGKDEEWFRLYDVVSPDEFIREQAEAIQAHVLTKSALYACLSDEHSKEILVLVALYALLGHRFVKFPYYAQDAITRRSALGQQYRTKDPKGYVARAAQSDAFGVGFPLARYVLPLGGDEVDLYTSEEFVYQSQVFPNYRYTAGDVCIGVEQGDHVLDCGACFGDTALMFAALAGERGKVISFEPHPEIGKLFLLNRSANPQLAPRITLIPKATSDTPGETTLILSGAGSRMGDSAEPQGVSVPLTTLDAEVAQHRWPRVDFIKMDIEGAELAALSGAVNVLRSFRPKLAVCLYHNMQDFFTIPHFLNALDLGYRFYLEHHYMNNWETVLYALADRHDCQ